eukprot:5877018-Prymnesium_polylepis.2
MPDVAGHIISQNVTLRLRGRRAAACSRLKFGGDAFYVTGNGQYAGPGVKCGVCFVTGLAGVACGCGVRGLVPVRGGGRFVRFCTPSEDFDFVISPSPGRPQSPDVISLISLISAGH